MSKLVPAIGTCLAVMLVYVLDHTFFKPKVTPELLLQEAAYAVALFTAIGASVWCVCLIKQQPKAWLLYAFMATWVWWFWCEPEPVFGAKSYLQLFLCIITLPLLTAAACFADRGGCNKSEGLGLLAVVNQLSYAAWKGMVSEHGAALTLNFTVISLLVLAALYIPRWVWEE